MDELPAVFELNDLRFALLWLEDLLVLFFGRFFYIVITIVQHVAVVELHVLHVLYLLQVFFFLSSSLDYFLIGEEIQPVLLRALDQVELIDLGLHKDFVVQ